MRYVKDEFRDYNTGRFLFLLTELHVEYNRSWSKQ